MTAKVERSIVVAGARQHAPVDAATKADASQLDPGHLNLLLIDEVDVFFSREFYGSTYDPTREFACPEAAAILTKIWQDRNANISFEAVQRMPEVAALKAKFRPEAGGLVDQHIHLMIEDAKAYSDPEGQVMDVSDEHGNVVAQKIFYRVQDSYSCALRYRYKTAFLYLEKAPSHPLLAAELPAALALLLPCGKFSYAEIPKKKGFFHSVMGVTGKTYLPTYQPTC